MSSVGELCPASLHAYRAPREFSGDWEWLDTFNHGEAQSLRVAPSEGQGRLLFTPDNICCAFYNPPTPTPHYCYHSLSAITPAQLDSGESVWLYHRTVLHILSPLFTA